MAAFIAVQVILIPILGLLWLSIRAEREKQKQLFLKALETSRANGYWNGRTRYARTKDIR